jgi:hypothetical protein
MADFLPDKEKRSFGRRIAELQGIDNIDEIIAEVNPLMEQREQMVAMGQEQGLMGQAQQQDMQQQSMQQQAMGNNLNTA